MTPRTCTDCPTTFVVPSWSKRRRCKACLRRRQQRNGAEVAKKATVRVDASAPTPEQIAELTEAIRAQWPKGEERRRAPYAISGPVEISITTVNDLNG